MKWCRNLMLGMLAALAVTDGFTDGCFVWHGGADLSEPSQKAIIGLRDDTETLVLQVKYEGPAAEFAWIVPLPAKPEVTAIEPEKSPFAELSRYTQARERHGRGFDGGKVAGDIEVLERKLVGVYDVAILAAADATALVDWLTKNGYAFPKNRTDVLRSYIRDRWVYVAMRIDPGALTTDNEQKLRRGELQPVRFRFPAKESVYPLRISSLNAGKTEVLLYLLADQPLAYASGPTNAGFALGPNLPLLDQNQADPDYGTFRKVDATVLPLTWAALNLSTNTALHLCKCRAVYVSGEMTGDLRFQPVEPVAFGKMHLEQAGNDWHQQRLALRFLAALDRRYVRRLREVERQIQEAWDKQRREQNALSLAKDATSAESANRVDAARHPELPRDLVRRLAQDSVPVVRAAVAARKDIMALRDVLQALARDPEKEVRVAVAFNEQVPADLRVPILLRDAEKVPKVDLGYHCAHPSILTALAGDTNRDVQVAVAGNTNTPPQALWQLATDSKRDVKVAAARNRKAPVALILKVAKDPDPYVRHDIAMPISDFPELPIQVLRELAKDPDDTVRGYTTSHRNLPVDLLRALAGDAEPRVRAGVASHPNLPRELVRQFATDTNAMIRAGVVRNPNCPTDVIRQLAKDDNPQVKEVLVKKADTPPDILVALAATMDRYVLFCLSGRAEVPTEALRFMANAEDKQVRERVAGQPNTPPEVLLALAQDENEEVRKILAASTNAPPAALVVLSRDGYWVRYYVAMNRAAPPEILAKLATDTDQTIRWAVAENPRTAAEVLRRFAAGLDTNLRYRVAGNPSTPAAVLRELTKDSDAGIAGAAQRTLQQRRLVE